jgi:NTP pyrophosphatase (non-canonical NTP hydrolase)
MSIKEYEDFMSTSKVYKCLPIIYPVLGMNGEAGEAAEKAKKCLRDYDGYVNDEMKHGIMREIADVLWYVWATADDMGYSLEDVMEVGIKKVKKRQETNTVHGEGDDREIINKAGT